VSAASSGRRRIAKTARSTSSNSVQVRLRDTSDPDCPKIVHGFVRRDAAGVQIVDT
jgi:hypothetical protein